MWNRGHRGHHGHGHFGQGLLGGIAIMTTVTQNLSHLRPEQNSENEHRAIRCCETDQ